MQQWSLIQSQPLLKTIYLKLPTISYKRDKSFKEMSCKIKYSTLIRGDRQKNTMSSCRPVTHYSLILVHLSIVLLTTIWVALVDLTKFFASPSNGWNANLKNSSNYFPRKNKGSQMLELICRYPEAYRVCSLTGREAIFAWLWLERILQNMVRHLNFSI